MRNFFEIVFLIFWQFTDKDYPKNAEGEGYVKAAESYYYKARSARGLRKVYYSINLAGLLEYLENYDYTGPVVEGFLRVFHLAISDKDINYQKNENSSISMRPIHVTYIEHLEKYLRVAKSISSPSWKGITPSYTMFKDNEAEEVRQFLSDIDLEFIINHSREDILKHQKYQSIRSKLRKLGNYNIDSCTDEEKRRAEREYKERKKFELDELNDWLLEHCKDWQRKNDLEKEKRKREEAELKRKHDEQERKREERERKLAEEERKKQEEQKRKREEREKHEREERERKLAEKERKKQEKQKRKKEEKRRREESDEKEESVSDSRRRQQERKRKREERIKREKEEFLKQQAEEEFSKIKKLKSDPEWQFEDQELHLAIAMIRYRLNGEYFNTKQKNVIESVFLEDIKRNKNKSFRYSKGRFAFCFHADSKNEEIMKTTNSEERNDIYFKLGYYFDLISEEYDFQAEAREKAS